MILTLDRFSYSPTETEGILRAGPYELATIECPWIPAETRGGLPFRSCVPDGEYDLEPWTRPKGEEVYRLYNPDLGVYRSPQERPNGEGRYLILMHIANWVSDVRGCIAPGLHRAFLINRSMGRSEPSVSNSGDAMKILNDLLGRDSIHTLRIRAAGGTE